MNIPSIVRPSVTLFCTSGSCFFVVHRGSSSLAPPPAPEALGRLSVADALWAADRHGVGRTVPVSYLTETDRFLAGISSLRGLVGIRGTMAC